MRFLETLALLGLYCPLPAVALDLRSAVIVVKPDSPQPLKKAAQMLTEEITKRTQVRLAVVASAPPGAVSVIALTVAPGPGPDGYRVQASARGVSIVGHDARGALFGAGYLLRHLRMERQVVEVDDNLQVSSAPRYPLRGHQLGYRPKVNAYDGWTPA